MKRQSLDEFLAEMAKKPQTLGWDVVLAFDRNKTNYLLLQDYISRFGAASLFPPVNSATSPVTGVTHQLLGLQLDKPRLSFENAVITESRAHCLMRTVGGRTIETTRPQGTTRDEVKRLGIADGLVGPQLTMTINLRNAPGSVGSAGKVELDLAGQGATDFRMSGVDTQFEAVKLGQHLEQEMGKWRDEQKKFELSELRQNPGDVLQPGRFVVLTRPAPGTTLRDADDFGDGEVLVMVGLDDRSGALPAGDTDMPYLLPQGYSSNLLIGYAQILSRMMINELKAIDELKTIEFDEVSVGAFKRYVAKAGDYRPVIIPGGWDGWYFQFDAGVFPFASANKLEIEIKDGKVVLKWAGSMQVRGSAITSIGLPAPVSYNGRLGVDWDIECHFETSLVEDTDGRTVIQIEGLGIRSATSGNFIDGSGDSAGEGYFKAVVPAYAAQVKSRLEFFLRKLDNLSLAIDAFRLNGLLFRDESVVVPTQIAWPGDLTALGHLAPQLTGYKLTQQEVTVSAEGSHAFTVEPANSGLTWSVAPLPGEAGGDEQVGTITANGHYTAPTAASFGYTFKRVVVSATDGTWTGKALVHLVAMPVSVFPRVNVVNLSGAIDEGYLVWAASTNSAALDWKITGNAGGRLARADDPDVQDAQRYFGPATFPSDGTNRLDRVLRVDRVEVAQGNGAATVCEMVLPSAPTTSYFFKHSEVANGLQLEFWVTDENGEQSQVPETMTEWHKVSGLGQLSASGLYTYPATGNDHYIIVAAFQVVPGVPIPLWNYVIIPLPLATLLPCVENLA